MALILYIITVKLRRSCLENIFGTAEVNRIANLAANRAVKKMTLNHAIYAEMYVKLTRGVGMKLFRLAEDRVEIWAVVERVMNF